MSALIPLDQIHDNPYQGRQAYENIESLARSIAADDLQETPKARKNGKGYQLKFGHRRCEAFRWLRENWQAQGLPNRYEDYTVMPLDIEELTDEQMFVGAVIENEHRENLNDIERARMMIAYRDQFQKTSEQVGEKFGVNGATVRGLIRLLDLPEPVLAQIETGELTQGQARKLLTIASVDEKEVALAAKRLQHGEKVEDVMEQAMRSAENAVTMWQGWNDGSPCGGQGLWPLAMTPDKFPMKCLSELTATDVSKALELEPLAADLRAKIEAYMRYLFDEMQLSVTAEIERHPEDADLIERIAHLAKPPACTACPFHAVADRAHYCGFKACHNRKKKAWILAEMQKVSKKLGIAVYDSKADGAATLPLEESSYEKNTHQAHVKLVTDKDADLRVAQHKNEYSQHKWTESHWCRLVLVGKRVTAAKEKKAEAKSSQAEKEEAAQKQRELTRQRNDASRKFLDAYALPILAVAFEPIEKVSIPVLCSYFSCRAPKADAAARKSFHASLRVTMASNAIRHLLGWQDYEKGPTIVAKKLVGLATTWGVKLPSDFLTVAKGFEPAVAVETKGKKK